MIARMIDINRIYSPQELSSLHFGGGGGGGALLVPKNRMKF